MGLLKKLSPTNRLSASNLRWVESQNPRLMGNSASAKEARHTAAPEAKLPKASPEDMDAHFRSNVPIETIEVPKSTSKDDVFGFDNELDLSTNSNKPASAETKVSNANNESKERYFGFDTDTQELFETLKDMSDKSKRLASESVIDQATKFIDIALSSEKVTPEELQKASQRVLEQHQANSRNTAEELLSLFRGSVINSKL